VFRTEDDGPGLRVDPVGRERPPWVAEALTGLRAGEGAPRGDLLAMVTALCSAVVADIWRDGTHWRQWADWQYPAPPMQRVGPTERHGTRIRYHLDSAYFGANAALPADIPALLANLVGEAPDHAVLSIDDRRAPQTRRDP
jgi:DNA gyrase/topoisomerase IV subunit B